MHSCGSPFTWNFLHLYVHGSHRASNVTNIKDLFQELSNRFMSQNGINLQSCIEVQIRYFRDEVRIDTSLFAHRTMKSWTLSSWSPEAQDQGQQLLLIFIICLQLQELLTCCRSARQHPLPALNVKSEGQNFLHTHLPFFHQDSHITFRAALVFTIALSFTFLSVEATCCQPSFFLLKAHLSGSQGFAKIKRPAGDSLCLHITTPKRCSWQKFPPTEVLPSHKFSLQEKAGLVFHTVFETIKLNKYKPLPLSS